MKLSLVSRCILGLIGLLALMHPARAEECTVRLSNALVEIGRIMPDAAGATRLPPRTVTLTAHCAQASRLLLMVQGANLGEQFKFAQNAQLSLRLSNAVLDGQAVELALASPSGELSQAVHSVQTVKPGDSLSPTRNGQAVQGSNLAVQIEISGTVPADEFNARDSKTLEGLISFLLRAY
ncbi:hypothetical protein NTD81_08400 [Pseudomonas sp. 5P_3.1_Bac2]|nr:hypothetical protein [Pseudomonas sp. 5P_3.1_Bac2]